MGFLPDQYYRSHELIKRIGTQKSSEPIDTKPPYGLIPLEEISRYVFDKNIALIGNSESLLGQYMGNEIDKYDVVIRMNEGFMIEDVIRHTGKRCDIWVCGVFQVARIRRAYDFFEDHGMKYIIRLNAKHYSTTPIFIKPITFSFSGMEEFKKLESKINSAKGTPSTGISAIDFFVNYCDSYKTLNLYGFDFYKTKTWYNKPSYVIPHNRASEKKFIESVIEKGRIHVHY